MENRITNKTSLNAKKVLVANLLKNKFITIMYIILALVFLAMSVYEAHSDVVGMKSQIVLHASFFFISIFFAFAIPMYRCHIWKRDAKRNYGSSTIDVEYQFTDINFKLMYKGETIDKFEYRNIYNVIQRKNLMVIVGSNKLFIIDIDGFKKDTEFARIQGYIKRFTK